MKVKERFHNLNSGVVRLDQEMFIYLFIYLSIYLFIYLSIYLFIYLFYLFIYLFTLFTFHYNSSNIKLKLT